MPKRAGLPATVRMRHDEHYVASLSAPAGAPIGRLLSIDLIDPNPDQPRQTMGDLSELMASIAEKGVIEPVVVRIRNGRHQSSPENGATRPPSRRPEGTPVVVRDVDDAEVIELALKEPPAQRPRPSRKPTRCIASPHVADSPRTTWPGAQSPGPPFPSPSPHKMPEEVNSCVGWPTFRLSHCLQIVRLEAPRK